MNLNREHRREVVRGLASAASLCGMLVGVPILLIVGVGWPLPRGIPSGSEALTALKTGAIPPSLILKPISLVVWILWLQMVAGVGIELWAHFNGRVAPRVSFVPSFMQRLSARLMGAVLVIAFSVQNPGTALADNTDLLIPTTLVMDVEQSWTLGSAEENTSAERRDSLEMLAGQYLGDPDRWTEVFVLNETKDSIEDPLEELEDFEDPVEELEDFSVTVQEGDTLWGLAAHHLDDPQRWVDIFNSNQDIIQDPDVLLPGWELQVPTLDSQPTVAQPPLHAVIELAEYAPPEIHPSPEPAQRASSVVPYAIAKPTVVASVPLTDTEQHSAPSRQTMLAVGGLGVFASSLGWVLARLRRTQRRRLPNGRMPVPPSKNAVELDQQLKTASDPDSALFLDASLRVMSSRIAGSPPPNVIGATLGPDSLSIYLSSPHETPPGFQASTDGMTWSLSKGNTLESLLAEADGVPAPLPTLFTVGMKNGNECLLNLEHMVALSLEGDSEAIVDLCSAIATQLASSHLADDLTVMCVGFGQDLTVLERVEYVPDVASAVERIGHYQRQSQALLGHHPSPVENRIGTCADFWQPMVTLVPNRLSQEEASLLLKACGSSVCVVANGLDGAAWVGQFDADGLLIQPIGLRLESHGLSGDAVAAFAQLASAAKDTEGVMLTVPPSPQMQHDTSVEDPSGGEIEVRVMGTVDIVGTARPFTSRRALDLVAFLAFHPEGADRDQLKAQIWPPDDPPSDSTLANTVSRARKALGVNDNGEPYLPRVNSKGVYQLRTKIGTDVDRFETLISAARNDPGERGRKYLQSALELARGTPFTGGAGDMYRWADFGLRTQIECLVDTVAHELARRCIDAGDFREAGKAAMASLRLVGVCEECYRWRLMAAAENPTEVRKIMAELVNLLKRESDQPESDDLLSADLLELYEQLMSNRPLFK